MAKEMRKVRTGAVVRTTMDQTAVVEMVWKQPHQVYGKPMRRVARFYVHDPQRQCQVGDVVKIEETRPISKTKHWRLMEVVERRQVAEVRPIDLESDVPAEARGTGDGRSRPPQENGENRPAGSNEDTGA
ncbi:MAG: 30S ribosomal protein S17 [Dehalococcoidia bacterium]|nr:30S ribosomal protein S17 [Dehalococcoidia bacterium]MSQ15949.1 30S ribosomal protein S17 [Dehalococcoidia bacterium]